MKRPPKARLHSKAFIIEHEGDPRRERLILKDGRTMEAEAAEVEEIKWTLWDACKWGKLPVKPQTVKSRLLFTSMIAFYTCVAVVVLLGFISTVFNIPIQVIKWPAIAVGSFGLASALTLCAVGLVQMGGAAIEYFKNGPATIFFMQDEIRSELCCIEALRVFLRERLDLGYARLQHERTFQIRNLAILGGSVVFLISPICTDVLKNMDIVRQYWMFTPTALAIPFVVYAICHLPILRLEKARYLVELASKCSEDDRRGNTPGAIEGAARSNSNSVPTTAGGHQKLRALP